jgi:hypothetical protein
MIFGFYELSYSAFALNKRKTAHDGAQQFLLLSDTSYAPL